MVETSEQLYARLEKRFERTRALQNLRNAKAVCDDIAAVNGTMSYSNVAKQCIKDFGAPRYQTILNNKGLKQYIELRRAERAGPQSGGSKALRPSTPGTKDVMSVSIYPRNDLDHVTRGYIDELRSKLEAERAIHQKMEADYLRLLQQHPMHLIESIEKGPAGTALQTEVRRPVIDAAVKSFLKAVLELPDKIPDVYIKEAGGNKRMVVDRRSGTLELISYAQFAALERLLIYGEDTGA